MIIEEITVLGFAFATVTRLDAAISQWEPGRRLTFELNGSRIASLYASGQIEAGIAAAEQLVKKQIGRVGETHVDTAAARGTRAMGLMQAGRTTDAIREFKASMPILMAASREVDDDDDATSVAARSQRLQGIVEAYISMLATHRSDANVAVETFALADSIRGQSVQRALSASSARAAAKDSALATLV